jgi:hydroxymethylglutaryl-CoA reductase (NADPH)
VSSLEQNKRVRHSEEDRKSRVDRLRFQTGQRLVTYSTANIDARSVSGNIENFIGTISIPVGLVGPLKVNFAESSAEVYAPLATTEGALVSSVQRGVLAMNLAGGPQVRLIHQKMIRAPQFEFENLDAALAFSTWIQEKFENLKLLVKDKSNHAALIELDAKCFGRTVHVRFVYSTGEAAGQNMTTFCTSYLCQWVVSEFQKKTNHKVIDFIIEGNLSSDKKTSFLSAIEGRGRTVIAECVFKEAILKKVFKMSTEEILSRFARSKSARIFTGQIGYNINVANVVAALFLSTGQDAACIHESSLAELHFERHEEGLYASLYMPCLVVGTIGGGTQLPSFKENLNLMGCQGPGSADRLAQIIAAYALSLEMSTVTAIGAGQFVSAHENLARAATKEILKFSDLNKDFFKRSLHDEKILEIESIEATNRQGYLTDIAKQVSKKISGFLAYEIKSKNTENFLVTKKAFLKLKSHSNEIVLGTARIIEMLQPGLAEMLIKHSEFLPFKNSHLREIEVLSGQNPVLSSLAPEFLGSFVDTEKEAFIVIQELLENHFIISEIMNLDLWTESIKMNCIQSISLLHKEFFNAREKAFSLSSHIIDLQDVRKSEEQLDLWDSLFSICYLKIKNDHPDLMSFYDHSLQTYSHWNEKQSLLPHTLIHYDFNPRNIAFKEDKILIFDWEFAAWGLPQRDLIEFILLVSKPEEVIADLQKYSELHYNQLSSLGLTQEQWEQGLQLSLQEFIVRRLPFYFVLSEFSFCPFIDRLLNNLNQLSKKLGSV